MALDVDFRKLREDPDLLKQLPVGIWLMDDHKWALLVWEQHRRQAGGHQYSLMHADFHWDAVDDFIDDDAAQAALRAATVEELRAMTADADYIKYDSFIAPAIRLGLLTEVHFYCVQADSEPLDESLCNEFCVRQVIHSDLQSLVTAAPPRPLIFDLCLDLFNRDDDMQYGGDLWSDTDVLAFLESVKHHIRDAELVTISLSFGYSGTEHDTRHLAELVLPKVVAIRS